MTALLARWTEKLAGGPQGGTSDSPPLARVMGVDRQQQLIHALITICLDFCNSILYNLPNKQIERLQRIQNQAVRMLKRIPRRNHITPLLRELHWLRIHDRIIFKILLLTHKSVNNTAPEYLCDLIRLNVESTTIRTHASFDPYLLCAAPTLWNALDLDIRLFPFDALKKKSQDTSLSEVLCKLILIVFILFYDIYVSTMCIYCDYCVYHYKSTELVSLYTLDIGL